jgi:primosomal protein N''
MSDPWGNDTATPSGFYPRVEVLIEELEDAAAQFQKFYEAIGTRFDISELPTKMRDFQRRMNQTFDSLGAHIEAPAKGAEQRVAYVAQRIAPTLFAIEQLCESISSSYALCLVP